VQCSRGSAILAVARCLSVSLSVCYTRRYSIATAEQIQLVCLRQGLLRSLLHSDSGISKDTSVRVYFPVKIFPNSGPKKFCHDPSIVASIVNSGRRTSASLSHWLSVGHDVREAVRRAGPSAADEICYSDAQTPVVRSVVDLLYTAYAVVSCAICCMQCAAIFVQ